VIEIHTKLAALYDTLVDIEGTESPRLRVVGAMASNQA
jgi:hypothetical protein